MLTSTRPAFHAPPVRHIPWATLADESEVSEQVWSALPAEGPVDANQVVAFLKAEGLTPVQETDLVYAYADGPREPGSPIEVEWYLQFRFEADDLVWLSVEKHLVGP